MGYHLLRTPEKAVVKSTVPRLSFRRAYSGREILKVRVEAAFSRK